MNFKQEIFKSIQNMIKISLANYKADRTYKTVIKEITAKGYVVSDRAGGEHTVKCSIPDVELKTGQLVWAKEPMGDIKGLHICGLVGK